MKLGYLDPQEVVAFLKTRDPNLHVALTGRGAPPEVCEFADTVSEVAAVKHHYKAGGKAQPGIGIRGGGADMVLLGHHSKSWFGVEIEINEQPFADGML